MRQIPRARSALSSKDVHTIRKVERFYFQVLNFDIPGVSKTSPDVVFEKLRRCLRIRKIGKIWPDRQKSRTSRFLTGRAGLDAHSGVRQAAGTALPQRHCHPCGRAEHRRSNVVRAGREDVSATIISAGHHKGGHGA
jgi:hypothetical protein